MTYFVMAPNLRWFKNQLDTRVPRDQVRKVRGSCVEVGEDRYIYPSSFDHMRGCRPCKVLFWGPPQFEITQSEILMLEMS